MRDENVKLKANLKATHDTIAEMNDQMAKCEAMMKEVTSRLHDYEDLEVKTRTLQEDLKSCELRRKPSKKSSSH